MADWFGSARRNWPNHLNKIYGKINASTVSTKLILWTCSNNSSTYCSFHLHFVFIFLIILICCINVYANAKVLLDFTIPTVVPFPFIHLLQCSTAIQIHHHRHQMCNFALNIHWLLNFWPKVPTLFWFDSIRFDDKLINLFEPFGTHTLLTSATYLLL